MASDPRLPDELRTDLSIARRNLELETRLIDDLLDLSRIRNGKLSLQVQPCSMRTIVSDVLEIVRSDVLQKSLDVKCEWNSQSDRVESDPTRPLQAIWNILKNAVKFSKSHGKLIIRLFNEDPQTVTVQVQDFGVGIDPEMLPRIFNAFEQSDAPASRSQGGLGLGLTITRAIVEMHRGTVRAESGGIDQGATISLTLPLSVAQPLAATEPKPDSSSVAGGSAIRVLLVEDHGDTAIVLGKLLRHCGHEVEIANSIASALQCASSATFDLIIADIGLPDGTGHDLMRQIKNKYAIPGIALTGYGMEDDLSRSREVGFAEHIVKPVNVVQLQSVIARVVSADGASRSTSSPN